MTQHWILAALIAGLAASLATAQTPSAPTAPPATVQSAFKGATIKIDGRMFTGIFASQEDGGYEYRALDIPDAKLRFTFNPAKDVVVVNRFSNTRAGTPSFDYFYVDVNNWGGALPGHVLRLGKIKIDVGQETWTDNPVENYLITNSASSVVGYDGGINLRGPISKPVAATYSVSVLNNGNPGTATRGLGTAAKVGVAPIDNLHLSASLYNSGEMVSAQGAAVSPALRVANLQSVPQGAMSWTRRLWEVDARWQYGKSGIRAAIPGALTPGTVQLATTAGHFDDEITGPGVTDRGADYWYAEGVYHVNTALYVAGRYSQVRLADGATGRLADSPINVNRYERVSLGAGYYLNPLTALNVELTQNTAVGGATSPKLNQIALGIAQKF